MIEQIEHIKVWAAYAEDSQGHRGGCLGYSSSHSAAAQMAENKGSWGGPGQVVEEKAIRIVFASGFGPEVYIIKAGPVDLDGFKKKKEEELRRQALAKLTDEEKEVLGL
jgi:uncharacterized membrane protein